MEFKFKIQPYQTAAADAVVKVFEGQPKQDSFTYLRDLGTGKPTADGAESLFAFSVGGNDEGYGNAPISLSSMELLDKIRSVQHANQIQESQSLFQGNGACSLDVEMETGTGKTYVYTKTMFELNKEYGWTKFIIVVPSVAIREGVYKSLQTTEQHFFEQYGKTIEYFIYDSDRLTELDDYSESSDISCMIINMQAFNTSMKENANNKASRIIFDERDEFGSRRPIDVIAANNPIVIVDEPQKMGKKGGATQKGIANFNPLFILNYSATHKEKHDLVYALDALDAFNQRLVKRIEVKGFELKNMRGTDGYLYLKDIIVSRNKAPEAVIEFKKMSASGKVTKFTKRFNEGDDIYLETGDTLLEAYKGFVIASGNDGIVPDQDGRLGYVRFLNGMELRRGEVYGDSAEEDMRRIQIRETIASHLEKEEALFRRGIKCLSLFFIDEVAKYRDITGNGETVGYGKIFEEEYDRAIQDRLKHPTGDDFIDNSYVTYLAGFDAHDVHSGYFSIDKKGSIVDSTEKKGEREDGLGANNDDARRAYDLILKNKERLLSFEEPVRFIFSHSALREGWDNPNIFQICTLKSSGSETGKRQEVGRGLRLCVDKTGERQDLMTLGSDVHNINVLTVIASESYSSFVSDLQSDMKKDLRERPSAVAQDFFTSRTVVLPESSEHSGEKVTFSEVESQRAYFMLATGGFIDMDGRPTEAFRENGCAEYASVKLSEDMQTPQKIEAIELLVKSVYDPSVLDGMFDDGNRKKVTDFKLNDNFKKKEFQELWSMICHKHAYTVDFDDEQLIQNSIKNIDSNLLVDELAYTLTSGMQKTKSSREELAAGQSFAAKDGGSVTKTLDVDMSTSVTYDLLGEISQGANITRRSAAKILQAMNPLKFKLFERNPEEFIKKVSRLIVDEKATMIVEHIEYHQLDSVFNEEIFTSRMPENLSKAITGEKSIQDHVFFDSDIERNFAEDLEAHREVSVYAKLPRSFKIPTPVGDYAPDWAIAFTEDSGVRHMFFIAETKGSMDSMVLKPVEQAKISCAKKVFNDLSTTKVRYHNVATYDDMLAAIKGLD